MNREQFFKILSKELKPLPQEERDSAIEFYTEYLNEAENEYEAIANLPHPKQIAAKLIAEFGIKEPKKLKTSTVVLLAATSPVSVPLAIAFIAVMFSFFIVLAVLGLVFPIVAVSMGATALASLVIIFPAFFYSGATGLIFLGTFLVCVALTIAFAKISAIIIKAIINLFKVIILKFVNRRNSDEE